VPVEQAPQVWIPDSSIWTGRVSEWPLQRAGGFGTSPVVFATSQAAVDRLGWATAPPTWADTLSGTLPVAIPRLADNAAGMGALLSLYQGLGRGERAERAVAGAVLVSQRTQAPTAQAAIDAAASNAPNAPLFLTSEFTVFSANRGQARPQLVAVYPRGGSPTLDYPVLRVAPGRQSPATTAAVQAVVQALTAPAARAAAKRSGLREPVEVLAAAVRRTGSITAPLLPPRAQLLQFLRRLDGLTTPSRLLVVVDVSLSMNALVPGTPLTRVQLAGAAAMRAGELLADDTAVGLWVFAADLGGGKPSRELVPVRLLSTANGRGTHRDVVNRELAGMPRRLSPGGTALYDTVLAAVSRLRSNYDPGAVNTVVLFTDGQDESATTLTLDRLANRLRADARANRDKPIQVVGIGLGPSADVAALARIAQATNGSSHRANTPQELQGVLFEALARRAR
jgi:hypothetical protein